LISVVPGWLVRQVNFECLSTALTPFFEGVQKSESAIGFLGYAAE